MIYRKFKEDNLSLLGFGTMRLPVLEDGRIDEVQTEEMIELAMKAGVNYFDTAYPYHGGESEVVVGRILNKYPRESYRLATKYPGHQIVEKYDPQAIFEEQLEKCGVEYFDYYLLHNVYENSMHIYTDEKIGVMEYFREQKKLGRIKHLGFSSHGRLDNLKEFLDLYGDEMEFCQIQLNYLDWTLQQAKEKYELLTERGIPVWVMEPVRGGKLANLPDEDVQCLKKYRPEASAASWSLRFLQDLPNVTMILSGMSNVEQMADNLKTFENEQSLSAAERELLLTIADKMKNSVPCTACRYCCDGCPKGIDIPKMLASYNEIVIAPSTNAIMWMDALEEEKLPTACIKCGKCSNICPQAIEIPEILSDFASRLEKIPKWADICKEREELAKRRRK
jgi:predicted aldo/keto reductase-like oxidoreductase